MSLGISTACLYPMVTEKALETMITLGFRTFEIFINSYSELEKGYIRELKKMIDDSQSRVKSLHPFTSGFESFLLFSGYQRRFEDSLEFYKRYYEAAAGVGAEILVLHGERLTPNKVITEQEYFERFVRLCEVGESFGVTLAQENVNACRSADPAFLKRMRKAIGERARFVFDIKQAVRAGFDPYDVCAAMGEDIIHMHINDNRLEEECLLPGKGTMDFKKLKAMLDGFGFSGDYVIEVYRKDYVGVEALIESYRAVKDILLAK